MKNEIKVIEVFPKDERCKQDIKEKKVMWLIEILREKYPDNIVEEAIKTIVSNQKQKT